MAYNSVKVEALMAVDSDLVNPVMRHTPDSYAPSSTKCYKVVVAAPASPGVTACSGLFTTYNMILVKNRDTSGTVTASWADNAASNTQRIPPGGILLISSSNDGITLIGSGETCEVSVLGT